jgi:hypothetical protein
VPFHRLAIATSNAAAGQTFHAVRVGTVWLRMSLMTAQSLDARQRALGAESQRRSQARSAAEVNVERGALPAAMVRFSAVSITATAVTVEHSITSP